MKKQFCTIFIFLIVLITVQAYGQDWPHNASNGADCDFCHFIYGTEPSLLPPWTAHVPQNIDDTQFNTLCWSCHNDIDAPFVNTHSSLQIDNSYGDWSIQCKVCHNPHGHFQIRTYGSESYLHEGISTIVTSTTITQTGAGWAVDQWKGLLVFPNILDLPNNYKILSNTVDTLTVEGPINMGAVAAGNTFVIVYSKLIPNELTTPNSGVRAVKFFDYTGPNSFADGDMVYNGICEVCHTMTTHHRNDGTGPAQSHQDGKDCISCHSHMKGFAPSGGIPAAPHNTQEFIDNCNYCHVTASDFTSPIPDAKCEQCHTALGALKVSFPTAPDVLTHQGTNCVGCHDPMFGTTNQKLVRPNLSAVGGGTNVVFPPFITGGPGYNGVCETCHTMTEHHRNDGSAPFQSHNDTSTCTVCHPHLNAFSPDVAPPPPPHDQFACEVCHVTPDTYVPNALIPNTACLSCHDGSQAIPVVSHFPTMLCVECHNPMSVQTNFRGNTNLAFIRSVVRGTNIAFEAKTGPYSFADDTNIPADMLTENYICNTCHVATNHHQRDGIAPGGQNHFDGQDCTGCHPHVEAFQPQGGCVDCHSQQIDGRRDVVNNDFTKNSHHIQTISPIDDASCIACHGDLLNFGHPGTAPIDPVVELTDPDTGTRFNFNGTPDATLTNFCVNCHDSDGASRTGGGGTMPFADSGDNNIPPDVKIDWNRNFGHRGVAECMECHGNSGGIMGDTLNPKVNGHGSDTMKLLQYAYDPNNELGFCENCHGSASTDWNSVPNVTLAFNPINNARHPIGTPLADTLTSSQLTGGYLPGDTMTCSDCHDGGSTGPHGSATKWMLAGPNKAWPYQNVSDNGTSSGTYFYLNGTRNNLFCANCHPNTGNNGNRANAVHEDDHHNDPIEGRCINCHIRVPHGGKVSRLINANNDGTLPARYYPDGNGGVPGGGGTWLLKFKQVSNAANYNKDNCRSRLGVNACDSHDDKTDVNEWW